MAGFPERVPGVLYLTEGGQETEVMYRHGFELPEFALFPLLERDDAMALLRALYIRYLDTAARHGFGALVGGLDYRASPDWAGRIGYSPAALADAQRRSIDFLREVSDPYRSRLPDVRVAGIVGRATNALAMDLLVRLHETARDWAAWAQAEVDTWPPVHRGRQQVAAGSPERGSELFAAIVDRLSAPDGGVHAAD